MASNECKKGNERTIKKLLELKSKKMNNNISDKNWDVLGNKVSEYEPNEYTGNDWAAMEKMLDTKPVSGYHFLKIYFPIILSALLLVAGFVLLNNYHQGGESTKLGSEVTSQGEQERQQNNSTINRSDTNSNILNIENAQPSRQYEIGNAEKKLNSIKIENKIPGAKDADTKVIDRVEKNKQKNLEIASARNYSNRPLSNLGFSESNSIKNNDDISSPSNPIFSSSKLVVDNTGSKIAVNREFDDQGGGIAGTTVLNSNTKVKEIKILPALALNTLEIEEGDLPSRGTSMVDIDIVDKRVKFGLLVGLNNSVTNYDALTTSHRLFFGVFAKKRLSKKWELELGAQIKYVDNYDLVQQFSASWYDNLGFSHSVRTTREFDNYRSIDIPLTLKYIASGKLSLVGGLRYSNILNRIEPISADAEPSFSNSIPRQGFWSHDLGIVLGTDYKVTPHWSLALRWNQGIRDITPDNLYKDAEGNVDDSNHFNSDLQLSVNYTF